MENREDNANVKRRPTPMRSAVRETLLYLEGEKGHVYTRASAIRWIRPHGTDPYKCWVALGGGRNELMSPEILILDSPDSLRHRVEMREKSDSRNVKGLASPLRGSAETKIKS